MTSAEKMAAELGLTIERETSPLQRGVPGTTRKRLLAKIEPERKTITLFALNIADHATAINRPIPDLEEQLIRHEIFHFTSWREKTNRGENWNPHCPNEEAAANEFAWTGRARGA